MSEIREGIKLAVFDINGTIHSDDSGIPDEVLCGLAHLQQQEIKTTSLTGRGVNRLRSLLGRHFGTVVSSDMPISVENGSRLVSSDGQNIRHYPLSKDEITTVVDGVGEVKEAIDYIAFYSHDPQTELLGGAFVALGAGDERLNLQKFYKQHGLHRSLGSLCGAASQSDLSAKLLELQPSMVIVGAEPSIAAAAFRGSNIIANGVELNIMSEGIDKSRGIEDIAEFAGVSLSEVLVAGNDHNDLTMLSLPVGESLAVAGVIDDVVGANTRVMQNPRDLGLYLESFCARNTSGPILINKEAA